MLLSIPFIMALFFWGRGLLKGSKSDFLLGLVLLILAAFLAMGVIGHSGVVSFIGGFLLLFGIVSFLLRKDAAEKKIMSKDCLIFISIVLIVIGILASMII